MKREPRSRSMAALISSPLFLVVAFMTLHGFAAESPTAALTSREELDARIAELIEKLGAPEYATREKAQAELSRVILDAFDALSEAQQNDDIEVAMRARYLVLGMQVGWTTEEDSAEVERLLQSYGGQSESERHNLIEQLGALPGTQSLGPLCRLARYETAERLSRWAALLAMALAPKPAEEQAIATTIDRTLGSSKRVASAWLRTYSQMLTNDPNAFVRWKTLLDDEERLLVQAPEQTNRKIFRHLLRWYADQLTDRQRAEEALEVMRKAIAHVGSNRNEVLDAVDWLREREAWSTIAELAERFSDTFQQYPLLMYRLAETHSKLGQESMADEAARRAQGIVPKDADKHVEVVEILQAAGLFQWAAFEYSDVIALMDQEPADAIRASIQLSEMLHEIGSEKDAGDALNELAKTIESNERVRKVMELESGRRLAGIR